jgi:glucose/arabinose dehydrogenase
VRFTHLAALLIVAQVAQPQQCSRRPQAPIDPDIPVTNTFTTAEGLRLGVQTIVTNVEIPWSLAFAPDGRLFFTERPGRVRIVQNGQLVTEPALVLSDVRHEGEGGLLGIAIHPNFASNHLVFLLYTANAAEGPVNRLVRYRESGNTLIERAVLLERMSASGIHDGGRLRFGPDGKLYLTMGDAANTSLSQSLSSLNGKILRLNDNGSAAETNPFGNEIWTYGHRNPQGLDWNPDTGDLYATEHGNVGNDEVNLLLAGHNYGWPVIEGAASRPDMDTPLRFFSPSIAPSGGSFYTGTRMFQLRGSFFFGALAGQHLHRAAVDSAEPTRIRFEERWLDGRFGRIRDVVSGPDGTLYFCTNNRDGRGSPIPTDDRIARIVPVQ